MLKLKRELNREKICCFAFPDYFFFLVVALYMPNEKTMGDRGMILQ